MRTLCISQNTSCSTLNSDIKERGTQYEKLIILSLDEFYALSVKLLHIGDAGLAEFNSNLQTVADLT